MSTPTIDSRDAASGRYRGMMIDAARQPESLPYYHRLIDFCADWGLNTLLFRLCDDQGCAVRFERRPDLVTHEHALNRAVTFITDGNMKVTTPDGESKILKTAAGDVTWGGPAKHIEENLGDQPFEVVVVEFKQ